MPLVDMKVMLQNAYHHGYAVGTFGVAGWDILEGVVAAADGMRATIPVAFQSAAEDNPQAAAAAISMGCDGAVINATSHPLPDSVAPTQKVVDLAATKSVLVVGQVGQLESGEAIEAVESAVNGSTSPPEAKYYVVRSGVDCLAVSVNRINSGGNMYDFTRLSKINQAMDIPLGIHGSAGFIDGSILNRQPSNKKLLLLTDDEPADNNVRDPQYLRFDAKQAAEELTRNGIATYGLSLDPRADQYVSRIFGAKNYMAVDYVQRQPKKLPQLNMGSAR